MRVSLITDRQRAQLLANGERTARGECHDPFPVVKLFTPDANATWLLSEIDPEDSDRAFGLCGLGLGCPELGYEITFVKGSVDQIARAIMDKGGLSWPWVQLKLTTPEPKPGSAE